MAIPVAGQASSLRGLAWFTVVISLLSPLPATGETLEEQRHPPCADADSELDACVRELRQLPDVGATDEEVAALVAVFEEMCEQGEGRACNELGLLHERGDVIAVDHVRACDWFRVSCDREFDWGCHNLGGCFAVGRGREKNHPRALELMTWACDRGNHGACLYAPRLLPSAEPSPGDREKACAYYRRAGEIDPATACHTAARALRHGKHGWQDAAVAHEMYVASCGAGNGSDCNQAGLMLATGEGLTEDDHGANAYYEAACGAGFGWGCRNLGIQVMEGEGTPRNPWRAASLLEHACDLGIEEVCLDLARRLWVRDEDWAGYSPSVRRSVRRGGFEPAPGLPRQRRRAIRVLEAACGRGMGGACARAAELGIEMTGQTEGDEAWLVRMERSCDAGVASACGGLGQALALGASGAEDHPRAVMLLEKGCTGNHGEACAWLGRMAEEGLGQIADPASAERYYARACELGFVWSCAGRSGP